MVDNGRRMGWLVSRPTILIVNNFLKKVMKKFLFPNYFVYIYIK